ncbi:hypothetical protein BDR06DRAFT_646265 [Suillus hirtellus]|nr:hypothetical protein BDR06DRAFT_646265 [Suillus hirtellus]
MTFAILADSSRFFQAHIHSRYNLGIQCSLKFNLTVHVDNIVHHLKTVFHFTKNDIRTTLIPVTIFALSAAPGYNPTHAWNAPLWIWFHLLQFNVANQIQDLEEDRKNKPSRPIPVGRISVDSAADMRWVMVPR